MQLSLAQLAGLTDELRTSEYPPTHHVSETNTTYRLLACYEGEWPAVLAMKVNHDNCPMTGSLVLMTASLFGVPTPGTMPTVSHPLTLHDVVGLVSHAQVGKLSYELAATQLLRSMVRHGIQPVDTELRLFILQVANSGALLETYDGTTAFTALKWAAWPEPETMIDALVPVIASYLMRRAEKSVADAATEALTTSPAKALVAA